MVLRQPRDDAVMMSGGVHARAIGIAAAIGGAISFGVNIPAAKIASLGGVNGPSIIVMRSFLLLAVLVGVMLALRRPLLVPRDEVKNVIGLGLGASCTATFYIMSISYIPVSLAVLLLYMFPLWLILLSPFTGGGAISVARLVAFAIAFCGIVLTVGTAQAGLDIVGLTLAFLASVSSAGMFIVAGRTRVDPWRLMLWVQVITLPVAVFALQFIGGFSPVDRFIASAGAVAAATFGFYLGFFLQLTASQRLPPATIGLLFLIEPVVSVVAAAVLLHEPLDMLHVVGACLVIGGLALDILSERKRKIA
jgi:drug/metabolite transporter (DMT)-like permease